MLIDWALYFVSLQAKNIQVFIPDQLKETVKAKVVEIEQNLIDKLQRELQKKDKEINDLKN